MPIMPESKNNNNVVTHMYSENPPVKLGESPIYRASDSTLHWVDFIDKPCKLYVLPVDPITSIPTASARILEIPNNEYISVIRFRKNVTGSYICAYSKGIGYLDEQTGEVEILVELVSQADRERGLGLNDGGVDPQGRFWVGGLDLKMLQRRMAGEEEPREGWNGGGKLWVYDGETCKSVLDGVICGNGIGWSPDGSLLYFNESGAQTLWQYSFNGDMGSISAPTKLINGLGPLGVLNDGMVVDQYGDLWIAMWNDGCVKVYTPDGQETLTIDVPAKCVTCPAWTGVGLNTLCVTTAQPLIGEVVSGDQGGTLFNLSTSRKGLPLNEFAG